MQPNRRAITVGLAAAGFAGFGGPSAGAPRTVEISMGQSEMKFLPASVTIARRDWVKWTNPGVVSHTVSFDPAVAKSPGDVVLPAGVAPFGSGEIEQGESFTHQFTIRGVYKYVCKYHQNMGMRGVLIVT